jgi:DNA repair exonuclease SbcCD nuclease subunit
MKLVVFSDAHINKSNRFEDTIDSLNQIKTYCKENKDVKYVISLGDTYTSRRPRQIEMRAFERFSQEISSLGIKQLYLVGNHDNSVETNSLGEFEELKIQNVKVVKSGTIINVGELKIYLGHEQLKEAELGPLNYKTQKDILTTEQLVYRNPTVNIFLFGHIHKFQILNKKPLVMYVGSIERENFGERNEKKLFISIDVETKKLEFHELQIRPMLQFDVDSLDKVVIDSKQQKTPIVKVVIKNTRDNIKKELSRKEKINELKDKCFDLIIKTEIEADIKKRVTQISDSETPISNLKLYCKERNVNEKSTLLGLKIIEKVMKK